MKEPGHQKPNVALLNRDSILSGVLGNTKGNTTLQKGN